MFIKILVEIIFFQTSDVNITVSDLKKIKSINMTLLSKTDIISLINEDVKLISYLELLKSLNLPDSWIGAGYIRNKIWDALHGYKRNNHVFDLDIIYFDASNISEINEKKIETLLKSKISSVKWSVKNQARMHMRNNHDPYSNSLDAIEHWTETATCIAVQKNKYGIEVITPYGISDLINLTLRPTPYYFNDKEIFFKRIKEKNWLATWPKLKIVLK